MSNANDDFPEPERPVITTNLSLGIVKFIFFKLCSFAPFITIESLIVITPKNLIFLLLPVLYFITLLFGCLLIFLFFSLILLLYQCLHKY